MQNLRHVMLCLELADPMPTLSCTGQTHACHTVLDTGQIHACVTLTGNNKADEEDEDIAAQLGVGSLAADVELDALKDAAEGEILGMHNLLARYAPLLAALCHNRCQSPAACLPALSASGFNSRSVEVYT